MTESPHRFTECADRSRSTVDPNPWSSTFGLHTDCDIGASTTEDWSAFDWASPNASGQTVYNEDPFDWSQIFALSSEAFDYQPGGTTHQANQSHLPASDAHPEGFSPTSY